MMPHSHRIVLGHRYFVISLAFSFLFHVARVLPATTGTDICEIHIGAMMNTVEDMETLQVAVREVNENSRILPGNYRLNVTSIIMTNNPIQSAIRVCEKIIPNEVYAVISGYSPELYMSSVSVSYTCGFYGIPVIGISARECIFSDKHIHKSYLRTVPAYSHQAIVWADIVEHFEWSSVVIITSSDQDGRSILSTFRKRMVDYHRFKMERSITYKPGNNNMTDVLIEVKKCQARVILLYASEKDACTVYQDAQRLNMTQSGYAWLVTEQGVTGDALVSAPEGVIGMRLKHGGDTKAHIKDSVRVVAKGIHSFVQNKGTQPPPSDCRQPGESLWPSGSLYYKNLLDAIILQGETGMIDFDANGDRKSANYDIINIQGGEEVSIGEWLSATGLATNQNTPVWPGGIRDRPEGYELPTHLRVVTLRNPPFVYINDSDPVTKKCVGNDSVPCLAANGSLWQCCSGFCIDLLNSLSKELNFTFDLHSVYDNQFGNYEKINGTEKRWNGMIGEILDGKADMIMAPLTITNERARFVDFSKPYKYQGLTILVKKMEMNTNLLSFMRPFEISLWILIGICIHVIPVVIYLLDRFSPFSHRRNDEEQTALNLSQAVWFSWSVVLNSGVGERTPRSFGARVLGVVWAGFAMIMVASYTANLAAYLVLDRPEARITGINDAKIRNPSDSFKYATVSKSSVEMYFRRQVELSTMYRFMLKYNYDDADDAIRDLKSGVLDAFIWDSAMLDFQVSQDCGLITVGELFGRSGFGIGLSKNSMWTQKVSLRILEFHEKGKIGGLENTWITSQQCGVKSIQPTTLGLSSMGGVFLLVAGGFLVGFVINRLEIFCKRHQQAKERQSELARVAVSNWRGTVRRRRKRNSARYMVPAPTPEPVIKSNGIQGPSSLEKEMDGAIPLAVIHRRSRHVPMLQPNSYHWPPSAEPYRSSPTNSLQSN
ncbi:glutamate receptor ionotropic, NMDA 1-like isoform X1 [Asterias rubens]|uniref:glutamate receptor ionotropic, NMDA 1-like isoform X1 n=1 Tax=Asterias rubens TaxID=7604 RepID=UPI0014554F0B|nr:glutamate receptor ionotropic, NMDA 1-like isoform X1 [Asterias rubens]